MIHPTRLDEGTAHGHVHRNRYLEGNFAPVTDEVVALDLPVTGTIPTELEGRYLRNGPNPIGPVDLRTHHWFIGTGMVHGVRLRDGKAEWYRNRFVRGDDVAAAQGLDPLPGPRHAMFGGGAPNTNVIGHAGSTWAIVESGGYPVELTYELDSVRYLDFDGALSRLVLRPPQEGSRHGRAPRDGVLLGVGPREVHRRPPRREHPQGGRGPGARRDHAARRGDHRVAAS